MTRPNNNAIDMRKHVADSVASIIRGRQPDALPIRLFWDQRIGIIRTAANATMIPKGDDSG
jgi:hypothetical protein